MAAIHNRRFKAAKKKMATPGTLFRLYVFESTNGSVEKCTKVCDFRLKLGSIPQKESGFGFGRLEINSVEKMGSQR
jgi:hypothetical protein